MKTVTEQVFTATELLEAVLAELPPVNLLHAQQVCKRWQSAVHASMNLQRKLFLKSEDEEQVLWIFKPVGTPDDGELNDPLDIECYWTTVSGDNINKRTNILRNPFFDTIFPEISKPYYGRSMARLPTNGSWESMYIASPPVSRTIICVAYDTLGDDFWQHVKREVRASEGDGIGVRMIDIVSMVQEVLSYGRELVEINFEGL